MRIILILKVISLEYLQTVLNVKNSITNGVIRRCAFE